MFWGTCKAGPNFRTQRVGTAKKASDFYCCVRPNPFTRTQVLVYGPMSMSEMRTTVERVQPLMVQGRTDPMSAGTKPGSLRLPAYCVLRCFTVVFW